MVGWEEKGRCGSEEKGRLEREEGALEGKEMEGRERLGMEAMLGMLGTAGVKGTAGVEGTERLGMSAAPGMFGKVGEEVVEGRATLGILGTAEAKAPVAMEEAAEAEAIEGELETSLAREPRTSLNPGRAATGARRVARRRSAAGERLEGMGSGRVAAMADLQ